MKAECAATWGVFCALRGGFFPIEAKDGVFADGHSPFEKETALRARYGDAIRKIEHFFPDRYRPLLHWLREEADLYNAKIIVKNILVRRDDALFDSSMLHPPAARFSPPASASIHGTADLVHHYRKGVVARALQMGLELLAQSDDFFLFESGCELGRIESLSAIASSFPLLERARVACIVKPLISEWEERLSRISDISPTAADALIRAIEPCKKRIGRAPSHRNSNSPAEGKDLYSPSWYFVQLMLMRERMAKLSSSFFEMERAS